ncbi:MAG: ATP-binding cassette domain-containing protein [Actinomycetota bacterium]|nr:ABC transporter ATP-binding protein [Acidimicrobiia bacterium]MDQ3294861.1 ATP-binding cassette domain-containing protein [Actinomycetota bacterium]
MNDPAVVVDQLWEGFRRRGRYGWRRRGEPHWALRDVTLSVGRGRSLGVVGANGSGKTTLLQVLAGVLRPTRGQVDVRGRTASLVDLSAGFHRDLTGHENVLVGGVLLGLTRAEIRARYDEVVDFSGLPADALDAPLSAYSAGMGLRLGFALVVHTDPEVLLVDEVLAVGDDSFRARALGRVDELRRGGTALVLVSHDLDLVRARCDDVAVLERGSLAHVGRPDEAVAYYRSRQAVTDDGAAERRVFDPSRRAAAARRRRGV